MSFSYDKSKETMCHCYLRLYFNKRTPLYIYELESFKRNPIEALDLLALTIRAVMYQEYTYLFATNWKDFNVR